MPRYTESSWQFTSLPMPQKRQEIEGMQDVYVRDFFPRHAMNRQRSRRRAGTAQVLRPRW